MNLLAIVCPNGLGHFRRVVAILTRLMVLRSDLRVCLACSPAQEKTLALPDRVRTVTGITEPGVQGAERAEAFADGRLRNWELRLAQLDLAGFDLVLSDNLTGILDRRPDAVLSGSFLWSEVLEEAFPGDPIVMDFVKWERELLARVRPPMLCVGALATPGVLSRTRAVDIGFTAFGEVSPVRPQPPAKGPWRVAVLGGATAAAATLHAGLIRGLAADPRWELALAPRDIDALGLAGRPRVVPFDFTAQGYRDCLAIVARPGLGTVHEAIGAGVPLVCSYESPQMEMAHVAGRLAELGLAVDFRSSADPAALGEALARLLRPEARAAFERARSGVRLDGIDRAARWLDARLASLSVPEQEVS